MDDDSTDDNGSRTRGAGGTPGGLGKFLAVLPWRSPVRIFLSARVVVTSNSWTLWGYNTFGFTLIPFAIGIGLLFFNGKSIIGWLLLAVGVVTIFAGIIANLQIYFLPTSVYGTIIMLVMLAGGIGLIARSLRPH